MPRLSKYHFDLDLVDLGLLTMVISLLTIVSVLAGALLDQNFNTSHKSFFEADSACDRRSTVCP